METTEQRKPILVAVVEDYALLRQKFAKLVRGQPDMECILQTDSIGKFFIEVDLDRLPDVLLLDVQLGHRNSIPYINQIQQIHPGIKIIIITGYDTADYILSALRLGINSYFIKGDPTQKLVDVVRAAFVNGLYFSPVVTRVLADTLSNRIHDERLLQIEDPESVAAADTRDGREVQFLKALTEGKTYEEIADINQLSLQATLRSIRNLYRKLGIA
jgi:DNA-binding NarL/FixJ family response regulator